LKMDNNVMKETCESDYELVNISIWIGMDIFGIFWWCGQNIFQISLCHIGMMWKIFLHMYMDENHIMDEKVWMKIEHH
jgi:hypothetical protein